MYRLFLSVENLGCNLLPHVKSINLTSENRSEQTLSIINTTDIPEEKNLMYVSVSEKHISQYSDAKIAFSNIAGRILGKEIELYL